MRWNSYALRLCVITFVGLFVQPSNVTAAVINVNCPVDNLSAAINAAVPGDTIIITGNCAENIFIGIDFLTLTGNSATDGVDGRVAVSGAQRVVLADMTVKNGGSQGISVNRGAAVLLDDVTVSGHSRNGVSVIDNSYVRIEGGTITANDRGVFVQGSSRASIDDVDITENTREGVLLTEGSSGFIGTESIISDNDRDGLVVAENSTVRIDDITISKNGRRAIQIRDSGFVRAVDSKIESDMPDSSTFGDTILVNRGSNLNLLGGNTVSNSAVGGGTAISVANESSMRQGFGDSGAISATSQALRVVNQSYADLRKFTLTGDVSVSRHSLLRLRQDTVGLITGDVEVARDSAVSFAPDSSGSVVVTGTVTCLDTESSADFEDQTAADIVRIEVFVDRNQARLSFQACLT